MTVEEENYTIKELHKQFSPNLWNPKKDKIDIITDHFRVSVEGTEKARQEIPCSLNNKYGEKRAQLYDVYGTDLNKSDIFVFIHGGGWQLGTKDISGFFAHTLRKWNIRTIVLGYTLAPDATLTEMVQQIKDGLKILMRRYPDSNFIINGHSAGAHLTSCLLHDDSFDSCGQIKKIVLFSGVFDLRPFSRTVFNNTTKITGEEAVRLSSVLQTKVNSMLRAQKIKVFVIVGQDDPPILKNQSEKYHHHLKTLGISCSFWLSTVDDHFSIVENLRDEFSDVTLQLKKFLVETRSDSVFLVSRL